MPRKKTTRISQPSVDKNDRRPGLGHEMPKKTKRVGKGIQWETRLALEERMSRNENFMTFLRKHGPAPSHQISIAKACEYFQLDPNDRRDWEICLAFLASVIFPAPPGALKLPWEKWPRQRGRPKKWTAELELGFQDDRVKAMSIEPFTDETRKIASRLQKPQNSSLFHLSYSGDYAIFGEATLIRYLRRSAREEKSGR